MPPDRDRHENKDGKNVAGDKQRTLAWPPLGAPINKRQQRQECHKRTLYTQSDNFTGENFQSLVSPKEIPLRLDVWRSQKRVCGLESRLGKEQAWSIKDDRKHESNKEADDCSVFNKIVGEEGDSILLHQGEEDNCVYTNRPGV